ncbi:MAG: hypothetical protein IAA81_09550 [Spirochaetes bacterium]|uniref:ATPase n=1 Tax=Candidatus Gallitreponema excrementavium TaxID=2840840 RepID=A0A9D9HQM6_9SPIR|nr:hypothetical protein [Candidatus Gallitreponema excrementavium]
MVEKDIIGHLIDVEKLASDLLADAQAESEKRLSAARAQADSEFRIAYEALIKRLDADYKNKTEEIEKKRDSDIKAYDSMLESIPLNQSRFDSFVDSKLFG